MKRIKKNFIWIFIIIITAVTFYIIGNSKSNAPLYTSASDSSYALASFQQKTQKNNFLTNGRQTVITQTVKKVSPAVVGINVTEIRQYQNPLNNFFNDPFFRQFFGNQNYTQKIKELGSGYIISSDGYIVTNDHVAGNATKITVTLTNGRQYPAKLVGTDHATDICLLKIDGRNFPYVTLGNSDSIMIGEWVIAFGNPFGLFNVNDKPTVTVGVVSSTGMNLEPLNNRYYLNMIQTDAAINGGNSGGPLVNSLGEVIGMNTLIFTAGGIKGNIGLGFAIPINKVKKIIIDLKKYGKVNRDYIVGLRIQPIDESIAKYFHLNSQRGVLVKQVLPNTPASKAGIKKGDIIIKANEYQINNEDTMVGAFQQFSTGDTVNLKIIRDGKIITKRMKLVKK